MNEGHIHRPLVAKCGRGMSLSRGRYTTRQQLDERKKAVLKFKFGR